MSEKKIYIAWDKVLKEGISSREKKIVMSWLGMSEYKTYHFSIPFEDERWLVFTVPYMEITRWRKQVKTTYDDIMARNPMTQKRANRLFSSSLGAQCNCLYTTSDGKVFIKRETAELHANGKYYINTRPLGDKGILEWYPNDGRRERCLIDPPPMPDDYRNNRPDLEDDNQSND